MSVYFTIYSYFSAGAQYETDEKERTLIDEHDAALLDKNVLKSLTKHKNVVKTKIQTQGPYIQNRVKLQDSFTDQFLG